VGGYICTKNGNEGVCDGELHVPTIAKNYRRHDNSFHVGMPLAALSKMYEKTRCPTRDGRCRTESSTMIFETKKGDCGSILLRCGAAYWMLSSLFVR